MKFEKLPTPEGDVGLQNYGVIKKAFPHPIKNAGPDLAPSKFLKARSLRETTGLPTPVETRVAPGIGSAGPSGRKSPDWKAVIAKDECHPKTYQSASVTTVFTKRPPQPSGSRFSANVGPRGPQGISTEGDEGLFKHVNMKMSNLDGPAGAAPRSTRFAATVRTAPGKQITTREETFQTGKVLKNKKVKNV